MAEPSRIKGAIALTLVLIACFVAISMSYGIIGAIVCMVFVGGSGALISLLLLFFFGEPEEKAEVRRMIVAPWRN